MCKKVSGVGKLGSPTYMNALNIVKKMRIMRREMVEEILFEFVQAIDSAPRLGLLVLE